MKRCGFNILAACSLLLCVASVVFGIRSQSRWDTFMVTWKSGRTGTISSIDGRLLIASFHVTRQIPARIGGSPERYPLVETRTYHGNVPTSMPGFPADFAFISTPFWLLTPLLAMGGMLLLWAGRFANHWPKRTQALQMEMGKPTTKERSKPA